MRTSNDLYAARRPKGLLYQRTVPVGHPVLDISKTSLAVLHAANSDPNRHKAEAVDRVLQICGIAQVCRYLVVYLRNYLRAIPTEP